MYELKTEAVYKDFSKDKEISSLVIIQVNQNIAIT